MKKILLSLLLLGGCLGGTYAQALFPDRCLGQWEGTMYIWSQGQLKDSVPVRMTVAVEKEKEVWTWRTEYLSPTRPMTKDYKLKLNDAAKRSYITDEGDGILLNDYEFGNKMYSAFEVQGTYLTANYEIVGDQLIFEVNSGRKIEAVTNGVTSYTVSSLQRVVYRRKK